MSTRRKPQHHAPSWVPMERGHNMADPGKDALMAAAMVGRGMSEEEARQAVAEARREVWVNPGYIVHVERRDDSSVAQLSIRRRDRKPSRDWRDFQRIKNDIAGAETEAVELYPAQSRVVDTANQYWLFVLPPGVMLAIGFRQGFLANEEFAGSVQRILPDEEGWAPTPTPEVRVGAD